MPIQDQKSKYFDMKLGGGVSTEMTSSWKFTSEILGGFSNDDE